MVVCFSAMYILYHLPLKFLVFTILVFICRKWKKSILVYSCDLLPFPSGENYLSWKHWLFFLCTFSLCECSSTVEFGALLSQYRLSSDVWWFSVVGSPLSFESAVVCLRTLFLITVAPLVSMVKECCALSLSAGCENTLSSWVLLTTKGSAQHH